MSSTAYVGVDDIGSDVLKFSKKTIVTENPRENIHGKMFVVGWYN